MHIFADGFNSYNHYIKLKVVFFSDLKKKKSFAIQITFHELNEIQLK